MTSFVNFPKGKPYMFDNLLIRSLDRMAWSRWVPTPTVAHCLHSPSPPVSCDCTAILGDNVLKLVEYVPRLITYFRCNFFFFYFNSTRVGILSKIK